MPRVDCIVKDDRLNPYERIQYLGGPNGKSGGRWKLTQADVIKAIENNTYGEFFVENVAGRRVRLVVAVSRYGNKYVKTEADGDEPNNLLSLGTCP